MKNSAEYIVERLPLGDTWYLWADNHVIKTGSLNTVLLEIRRLESENGTEGKGKDWTGLERKELERNGQEWRGTERLKYEKD